MISGQAPPPLLREAKKAAPLVTLPLQSLTSQSLALLLLIVQCLEECFCRSKIDDSNNNNNNDNNNNDEDYCDKQMPLGNTSSSQLTTIDSISRLIDVSLADCRDLEISALSHNFSPNNEAQPNEAISYSGLLGQLREMNFKATTVQRFADFIHEQSALTNHIEFVLNLNDRLKLLLQSEKKVEFQSSSCRLIFCFLKNSTQLISKMDPLDLCDLSESFGNFINNQAIGESSANSKLNPSTNGKFSRLDKLISQLLEKIDRKCSNICQDLWVAIIDEIFSTFNYQTEQPLDNTHDFLRSIIEFYGFFDTILQYILTNGSRPWPTSLYCPNYLPIVNDYFLNILDQKNFDSIPKHEILTQAKISLYWILIEMIKKSSFDQNRNRLEKFKRTFEKHCPELIDQIFSNSCKDLIKKCADAAHSPDCIELLQIKSIDSLEFDPIQQAIDKAYSLHQAGWFDEASNALAAIRDQNMSRSQNLILTRIKFEQSILKKDYCAVRKCLTILNFSKAQIAHAISSAMFQISIKDSAGCIAILKQLSSDTFTDMLTEKNKITTFMTESKICSSIGLITRSIESAKNALKIANKSNNPMLQEYSLQCLVLAYIAANDKTNSKKYIEELENLRSQLQTPSQLSYIEERFLEFGLEHLQTDVIIDATKYSPKDKMIYDLFKSIYSFV